MPIPLLDSGAGLFEIFGKLAQTLNVLNVARGVTVAGEALDAVNQYKLKTDTTLAFDRAVSSFANGEQGSRRMGDGFAANIAATCRNLLAQFVKADNPSVGDSLTAQLEYLIADMVAQDFYVEYNTVSAGALTFAGSEQRDFGAIFGFVPEGISPGGQNALAETLLVEVLAQEPSGNGLRVVGERPARNKLSEGFPAGSGISQLFTALTPETSLLENADFRGGLNDIGSSQYVPAAWTLTGGSGFDYTSPPVVEVVISGTPTSGEWTLKLKHKARDREYTTAPIAYNANTPDVEAAVRSLPGFDRATVSTTGTSPNFTHRITCHNVPGSMGDPGVWDSFNTGSVSADVDSGGSAYLMSGTSIVGSGNHTLAQAIALVPGQAYVLAIPYMSNAVSLGGLMTISVRETLGGNLVEDATGAAITTSITLSGSGPITSPRYLAMVFALPESTPSQVAIELNFGLAGTAVFLGGVILGTATELYAGGPVGAFLQCSNNPEDVGKQGYSLTIANNRVCAWQQFFDQVFDMAGKRLSLPVSGDNEIEDSLIG